MANIDKIRIIDETQGTTQDYGLGVTASQEGLIVVSPTEPTGNNKPSVWIQPDLTIYGTVIISGYDSTSGNTYYYAFDDTTHTMLMVTYDDGLTDRKLIGGKQSYSSNAGHPEEHAISVEPNTLYRMIREGGGYFGNIPTGFYFGFIFLDENYEFISMIQENVISSTDELGANYTFTTPAGAKYCYCYEYIPSGASADIFNVTFQFRLYENDIVTETSGIYYYDSAKNNYRSIYASY